MSLSLFNYLSPDSAPAGYTMVSIGDVTLGGVHYQGAALIVDDGVGNAIALTGSANGLEVDVTLATVEGVVRTAAQKGIVLHAVRQDTAAALSGVADGDYSALQCDATGKLWVNADTPTKVEGVGRTDSQKGLVLLTVRNDTAAALGSVDNGDYSALQCDANGKLWVNAAVDLGSAIALSDTLDNPTVVSLGSYLLGWSDDDTYWHRVRLDTSGRLMVGVISTVVPVSATAVATNFTGDGTSVELVAANGGRKALTIFNDSGVVVYVNTDTATSTAFLVKLQDQDYYEFPSPIYNGAIQAIWASGDIRVMEFT